jgi:hypothetical protein
VYQFLVSALQLIITDQLLYYCTGTFYGSRTTRLSIFSQILNSTWPPRGNLREISSFLVCALQGANIGQFFPYFVCMCYLSGSVRLSILAPIQNPRWPPLQILYVAKCKSLKISFLQLPNALMTYQFAYRKSYLSIKLVTSNLTFDLK